MTNVPNAVPLALRRPVKLIAQFWAAPGCSRMSGSMYCRAKSSLSGIVPRGGNGIPGVVPSEMPQTYEPPGSDGELKPSETGSPNGGFGGPKYVMIAGGAVGSTQTRMIQLPA